MQKQPLSQVTAAIFDPVEANYQLTRNVLYSLGLRGVHSAPTLSAFRDLLKRVSADLCLVDLTAEEVEGGRLIRDLRAGALGSNPFAVVITTSWRQSADLVRQAMDVGADDLILRPFSTATVRARLEQQMTARKRFVVSSVYIGPDRRRSGGARWPNETLIDVPNSLRIKAEGEGDGVPAAVIAQAQSTVNVMRVQAHGFSLTVMARLALETIREGQSADAELANLKATQADLIARTKAGSFAHLGSLIDALREAFDSAPTVNALEGFIEAAMALHCALQPERLPQDIDGEVRATLERIRTQRRAEAARPASAAG
jgi:DNA-binding response OmpR family regulator